MKNGILRGDERINLLVNDIVDTTTRFEIKPTDDFNFDVNYLEEKYESFDKICEKISTDYGKKKVSMKKTLDKAIRNFKEQVKDIGISIKTTDIRDEKERFLEANLEASYYSKNYLINWYKQGIKFGEDFTDKFRNENEFVNYIFDSPIIKKSKIKDKISVYNLNKINEEFSNIWGIKEDEAVDENKKYTLLSKSTKEFGISYIGIKRFLDDYEKAFYSKEILDIEKDWEYIEDFINYEFKKYQRQGLIENKEDRVIFRKKARKSILKRFENIKKDNYKSPLNLILFESEPEKKFLERLFINNRNIKAWLKSKSRGFYHNDKILKMRKWKNFLSGPYNKITNYRAALGPSALASLI